MSIPGFNLPPERRYVTLAVDEVVHATGLAILFLIDGDEVWIPRSQLEDPDAAESGGLGEVSMTEWIARQKGLL